MSKPDLAKLALAVALTAVAGCVNAIGFLKLGHLFVSFMSGDSTQLSVRAAEGSTGEAFKAGRIIILFVAGVVVGYILAVRAGRWGRPAVLLLETAMLVGALLLGGRGSAIVFVVLAMGIQNAAVRRAGQVQTNLTYVTGTLVHLGEKLGAALMTGDPKQRWAWFPYLLMWAGLVLGAVIGAVAYGAWQFRALALPASATALLMLGSAWAACRSMHRASLQ